jgi:hypothetical protein
MALRHDRASWRTGKTVGVDGPTQLRINASATTEVTLQDVDLASHTSERPELFVRAMNDVAAFGK